ncbi:MAG: hypothetical protein QF492_02485 [Candidatus Krumholzibacteria bacterium]|nr:hypothetical protein [Candidatus Krumholzibacteria bacterium]MDP6668764.1 hypothetical protein [Candidatus Krumholzibacteria bacterium]MDP6797515.1 hypothetical protein [Candidatus Krumholzibacteria bacterium]MDP7021510.1 hypothetical protein [Candidatus Krumholzibacteria bacterium]
MTDLNEHLLRLVALQDLDDMIRETEDKTHAQKLADMGFGLEGLDDLQGARKELSESIRPQLLSRYERTSKRLGRAVVPVTGNLCLGCFAVIPTAFTSAENSDKILHCENCGRILYWPGGKIGRGA